MSTRIKHIFFLLLLKMTTLWSAPNQIESPPVFISLGQDCQATDRLRSFNLRKHAYPFDWNFTKNFSDVCHLIENQFTDLLNPLYLVHDGNLVINTKYEIFFNHDFPADPRGPGYTSDQINRELNAQYSGVAAANFLDYLPEVTEKYNRRIKRFLTLLNSESIIIFIRTNITPKETTLFTQLMATKYPLAHYTLLVTHRNKDLDYDWKIPHVANYYMEEENPIMPQWAHPQSWENLFIALGFEKWKVE